MKPKHWHLSTVATPRTVLTTLVIAASVAAIPTPAGGQEPARTLKMQSSWPASLQQQEAVRSAVKDAFLSFSARWQRQNADAMDEMIKKHGAVILRTPPEILIATLKAWDEIAREESAKNPVFKKIYDSQRAYAARVVPAKRYMFPPYSFAANYYFPETKPGAEVAAAKK